MPIAAKQVQGLPPPDLGVRAFLDSSGGLNGTGGLINQSASFAAFLTMAVNITEAANYRISWVYNWSQNSIANNFRTEIRAGAAVVAYDITEPTDSAGDGIVLDVIGGGTADTATDQQTQSTGSAIIALPVGLIDIALFFASEAALVEAAIYNAQLSIERFS